MLCELLLWLLVSIKISRFDQNHGYLSSVSVRLQKVYWNTWTDSVNAEGTQSMSVLTILGKITEMRLKCSQGSVIKNGEKWRSKGRERRKGKGITLVISNENISGIIKIIKSFENSNLLIHGVSKILKHETKKHEGVFLGMLLRTLPEA